MWSTIFRVLLIVMFLMMILFQLDEWRVRSTSTTKLGIMILESESIVDRLRILDNRSIERDSILMGQVSISMGMIVELSRLREMSKSSIDILFKEISCNKEKLDSIKVSMLSW